MIECDCGCKIMFPTPEKENGFILSKVTCPECGQMWKCRITKSISVELK